MQAGALNVLAQFGLALVFTDPRLCEEYAPGNYRPFSLVLEQTYRQQIHVLNLTNLPRETGLSR